MFEQVADALLPFFASMKALPKRKGNLNSSRSTPLMRRASMKALPKRKGNSVCMSYSWIG